MPPRTNDNAPDDEQASQPQLTRPAREFGPHPTDPAGAAEGAGGTDGHTDPTLSVPTGTDAAGPSDTPTDTPAPATVEAGVGRTRALRAVPAPEQGDSRQGPGDLVATGAGPEAPAAEAASQDREVPAIDAAPSAPSSVASAEGASGEDSPDQSAPDAPSPGSDERVAAVRRLGESSRRWRALQLGACAAALAVAFTAGAVVLGAVRDGGATANVSSAPAAMSPALLASGDLDASIASIQAHLRSQPKDFGSWATLGLAYVEQARTKGDPSRYPQAQQALARSLELRPDNDSALAGRAALAAARHDFPGALKYADQALKQNPYSERALSTRIDALVELGRYDEASKAADEADDKRPGVPVFTRYAYVRELRGDVSTARGVLERALGSATSRGDIAYVATALGQLAWNQGEYKSALEYYARALAADDAYLPALEGRSRAQFADGDLAGAVKGMEELVSRYPLPGPLVELGELYEVRGGDGDLAKAGDQYALVNAWTAIARANGVNADLDTALAAADHGDKKSALRAARAEWDRRETVHTADALAWALHVNGQDEEALPYARRATATGYRNASFLYHRGMIEQATGNAKEARASLSAALELNPGFSPLGAQKARTALKSLEAAK
ncbi:tetratricopeptide repeat protein [Streptomyces sp. NPDC000878]